MTVGLRATHFQRVREAVRDAFPGRVFELESEALAAGELPVAAVWPAREQIEIQTNDGLEERRFDITVTVIGTSLSEIDELEHAVNVRLGTDENAKGALNASTGWVRMALVETTFLHERRGEDVLYGARLTFNLRHWVRESDPSTTA